MITVDEAVKMEKTNSVTGQCIKVSGDDTYKLEALVGYSPNVMHNTSPIELLGRNCMIRDYTKIDGSMKIFLCDGDGKYLPEDIEGLKSLAIDLSKELNKIEFEEEYRDSFYELSKKMNNLEIISMMESLKFQTTSENGEYQRTDKMGRYVVSLFDGDSDGKIEFVITDYNKLAEGNIDKIEKSLIKEIKSWEKMDISLDTGIMKVYTAERETLKNLYEYINKLNPKYNLYFNMVGSLPYATIKKIRDFKKDDQESGFLIEQLSENLYNLHYKHIDSKDIKKITAYVKKIKK